MSFSKIQIDSIGSFLSEPPKGSMAPEKENVKKEEKEEGFNEKEKKAKG